MNIDEFRDTISREHDCPMAFMNFGMMMPAEQTLVGVSTFTVMDPVDHVVGVAPGDRSVTAGKRASFIPQGDCFPDWWGE